MRGCTLVEALGGLITAGEGRTPGNVQATLEETAGVSRSVRPIGLGARRASEEHRRDELLAPAAVVFLMIPSRPRSCRFCASGPGVLDGLPAGDAGRFAS
jgi:hypothetical protein